jgi:hypothetical protein
MIRSRRVGRAGFFARDAYGRLRMLQPSDEADQANSVEELQRDEFTSAVAVIACVTMLLIVVVVLAVFTRLGGL